MTEQEVHEYCLGLANVFLDFPFGEGVAVYKVKIKNNDDKMFALMQEKSVPLRLSLKCDPQLAVVLRERYESVLEGYHLNKKHWNTLLLTGQLNADELKDLIIHSYNLVIGSDADNPTIG